MSEENYLKCSCKECGNHIEFPPSAAGTVVECPHCHEWTELDPEKPAAKTPAKGKFPLVAVTAGCVVVAAVVAGSIFLRARSKAAVEAPTPAKIVVAVAPTNTPPPTNVAPVKPAIPEKKQKSLGDLKVSPVQLEKAKVGSLVYAIGTVTNASEFQRFGVKIELNLYNSNGKKVGATTDYKDIIEPNHEWQFRAMVLDARTATAKVSAISEE